MTTWNVRKNQFLSNVGGMKISLTLAGETDIMYLAKPKSGVPIK